MSDKDNAMLGFGTLGLMLTIGFAIFFFIIGHIILWNSILFGAITYFFLSFYVDFALDFYIHPAFALIVAIIVFGVTLFLQHTKIGFWVISSIMAVFYGVICGRIAYQSTEQDWIWTIVIGVFATIIFFALHWYDKNKNNLKDVD